MLFYKLENNLWPVIKTFVVFLDRLPEYSSHTYIHEIEMDEQCLKELEKHY